MFKCCWFLRTRHTITYSLNIRRKPETCQTAANLSHSLHQTKTSLNPVCQDKRVFKFCIQSEGCGDLCDAQRVNDLGDRSARSCHLTGKPYNQIGGLDGVCVCVNGGGGAIWGGGGGEVEFSLLNL